mmetsp:Transcript_15075/g.40651  ORF Transcript_15075/g.40651 Transcript_15075/m.40651 type:complete len:286 (-) Transcript_15075:54-911(-)
MYGRGTVISAQEVYPAYPASLSRNGSPSEACVAFGNCAGCTRPGGPDFLEGSSLDGSAIAFVGGGQGAYVQEVTYKFVGAGAGEFEIDPPSGRIIAQRAVFWLVLVGGVLVLFGILCLCFGSVVRPSASVVRPPVSTTTTRSPIKQRDDAATTTRSSMLQRYDCQVGFETWEQSWSPDKKQWCCELIGLGCLQDVVQASLPTIPLKRYPFDCSLDFENWTTVWSTAKQDWCCKHRGRACDQPRPPVPAPPSPGPPDPDAGQTGPPSPGPPDPDAGRERRSDDTQG